MKEIAMLLAALSVLATGCFRERHDCREHENWDGGSCHAERGYEHYWDHPDHRDWHRDDHRDERR